MICQHLTFTTSKEYKVKTLFESVIQENHMTNNAIWDVITFSTFTAGSYSVDNQYIIIIGYLEEFFWWSLSICVVP